MGKVVNLNDRRKEKKCNTIDDVSYTFDIESVDPNDLEQSLVTVSSNYQSNFDKVIDVVSLIDALNDELEYLIQHESINKFEIIGEDGMINVYIYPTVPVEHLNLNMTIKKEDE